MQNLLLWSFSFGIISHKTQKIIVSNFPYVSFSTSARDENCSAIDQKVSTCTLWVFIFRSQLSDLCSQERYRFRLVHSEKQTSNTGSNELLTFGTRSGTRQGVEAHVFRVESVRDLSAWSRALVHGAHNAAALVKEVSCRKYTHYALSMPLIVHCNKYEPVMPRWTQIECSIVLVLLAHNHALCSKIAFKRAPIHPSNKTLSYHWRRALISN